MTPPKAIRDVPASVRQRLLNLARGQRVRFEGMLQRYAVPVDIGFGDVITLGRKEEDYPTLLDLPAPRLWTYPRETLVAEKFQAMASLGDRNSRVKDLWDVACLARRFAFDGDTLRTAIAETCRHRGTSLTGGRSTALLAGYYGDREAPERGQRWRELRRQIGTDVDGPDCLVDAQGAAALPGAGLGQPDRGEPVHAGLARRRAVAAGDSGSDRRRRQ